MKSIFNDAELKATEFLFVLTGADACDSWEHAIEREGVVSIRAGAPGRICLFGEHQDYLGLPVIAMAVDLRFSISFDSSTSRPFRLHTPDLGPSARTLDIDAAFPAHADDFCWGIAQVLKEHGFRLPSSGDVTFQSNIPIRAGCSSSSAMSAAWMRLMIELGEHREKDFLVQNPELAAWLVYQGEKVKFNGAGGMMDQYSCYLGGLVYVYPKNPQSEIADGEITGAGHTQSHSFADLLAAIPFGVERLPAVIDGIILIDSGEPKDTQGILSSVGNKSKKAISDARTLSGFDLIRTSVAEFDAIAASLSAETRTLVRDQLINRDLCREGLVMLRSGVNPERMGMMLNEEHRILSETLGISTPRIEKARSIALQSGALGAKINGSGGGGTLFAYAPGKEASVSEALKREGIRHFIVAAGDGARIE